MRALTCCSCVRAPLGESLSPLPLSPQLRFPKEKKRRTRSGEEEGRHYGKLTEIPLSHAQSAPKLIGTWAVCVAAEGILKRNSTGDCIKLTVVSCARPAQRYVGTTMDRIIIEKATWWTGRRRRLSRFFFLFLNARLNLALVKKALREQKSDCSIVRDIYFLPFPCLISVKTLVKGKKQNKTGEIQTWVKDIVFRWAHRTNCRGIGFMCE